MSIWRKLTLIMKKIAFRMYNRCLKNMCTSYIRTTTKPYPHLIDIFPSHREIKKLIMFADGKENI